MKTRNIIIIVLAALCAFLILERSCVGKKLQEAIGAHEQQKKSTESAHRAADRENERHEGEKRRLQEDIRALTRGIRARDRGDAGKEEKLEELEKEEPELEDKDEIIKNVRVQNTILRAQLATARFTIRQLGRPTFTLSPSGEETVEYPEGSITYKLNRKYLEQVSITDVWIGKFNNERALRISAESVAEVAIKKAARLELGSDLKTYGVIILTGILIFL